jgi:bacterioferritin-associated ferredoxin
MCLCSGDEGSQQVTGKQKTGAASDSATNNKQISENNQMNASCASCKTSLMKAETLHREGKMAPAINVLCEILCKDHESDAHRVTVDVALGLAAKIFSAALKRKGRSLYI